ncbi:DUF2185 domain-containing protein [Novosphingobium sp. 9]|uniref:DUF2185 domain-containing protein n=1 Tax=Novosphingobium sp. 9 TaxID=2025349 RepID=UPI0021B6501F|nr:DUF2185 domain-containing protein [Novosphingobium sp. 9]
MRTSSAKFSLCLTVGTALAICTACTSAKSESEPQPMQKQFKLAAEQIRPLALGRGGAIASDRITVDGRAVGYMYRLKSHDQQDSGWAFLAGDESDEYMANPGKHAIYDVNTIANYDPEIIPLLDAPVGSAFIREKNGLVRDPLGAPSD